MKNPTGSAPFIEFFCSTTRDRCRLKLYVIFH
jgi:hypothetical protein